MIDQQLSLLDRSAPDPHEHPYFGWALDDPRDQHPDETATRAYMRRYGQRPEFVIDGLGGNLLLGPVPAEVQV